MNQVNEELPVRRISQQMKAVIAIFGAHAELLPLIGSEVNLESESIDWDQIFSKPFSPGLKSACQWAFAIWRDEVPEGSSLFNGALSMDADLKAGVIRALRLRWGLIK